MTVSPVAPNPAKSFTPHPEALPAAVYVTVVATLPPPVTGKNVVTERVVEALRGRSQVRLFNHSDGVHVAGRTWKIVKALRSIWSSLLLLLWRPRGAERLYTVANSEGGLLWNILILASARLVGYRCILHHHAFSYLHQRDWRMSLIDRLLGRHGLHVVLGPEMAQRLAELYHRREGVIIVSNAFLMADPSPGIRIPAADADGDAGDAARQAEFCLGHLSNLTVAKGLDLVLETFAALARERTDLRLIIAGPCASEYERELIRQSQQEFGTRVEYRGPVYGLDKSRFFEDVDVFLFPTRYINEAQPLVLVEAFAAGKPVIAYGRGGIPSLMGDQGGMTVPEPSDFAAEAAPHIRHWMDDRGSYQRSSVQALNWAATLQREGCEQFQDLLRRITGP